MTGARDHVRSTTTRPPVEPAPRRVGVAKTGDDVEHRALAGAVSSHQRHEFAGARRNVTPVSIGTSPHASEIAVDVESQVHCG